MGRDKDHRVLLGEFAYDLDLFRIEAKSFVTTS